MRAVEYIQKDTDKRYPFCGLSIARFHLPIYIRQTPSTRFHFGIDSTEEFMNSSTDDPQRELMLGYIGERKRMDDLSSSIMDGRFREQHVCILLSEYILL